MSWYKDWFNSEHYLRVYNHRDQSEAARVVDLIIRITMLNAGAFVLDMACGAGRHAIAFAKAGFNVTAVDLSQRLIEVAKKSALQANAEVNFFLSDILEYESLLKYDLVVNLFTSIGYFDRDEENYAVIQKSYSLIKPGGFFVLDYFNRDFLLNNIVPTTIFSEDGFRITQNRTISENRVVKKIIIENNSERYEHFESVRLYTADEIFCYFQRAGLTVTKVIGDYFGNDYSKENSPRLIIFAKK